MSRVNICISCDDNYAKYAGVVIASVLCNAANDDNIVFYLLDGGISQNNKDKILSLKSIKECDIHFITIDRKLFVDYEKIKTHKYISVAACYRLKASSLLQNLDKVIYLDCDVIVNTSLNALYETDLSDYLIAGVSDNKRRIVKNNPSYVNSGVLVMNLAGMRADRTEDKFLDYTLNNKDYITKGDQEIINEVCKDKIKLLASEWNVQTSNFVNRSSYTNTPKIIHYLSKEKPWKFGSFSYFKNYWFKYYELTPWAKDEKYDYTKNQIASIFAYLKHRPLFFLRPRFYKAVFMTYIKPLFGGKNA